MEIREDFIINQITPVLIPKFGEHGHLYTKVIEGHLIFLVKQSPLDIIKNSMQYYGHDWEGAKKATKTILGRIDMPPVKISGSLGIYWFPTKSPEADDCVWFALDHVQEPISVASKKTKVFLPFGHSVTIPIRKQLFKNRVHRARDLKAIMEQRTWAENFFPYGPQKHLPIVSESPAPYHLVRPREIIVE